MFYKVTVLTCGISEEMEYSYTKILHVLVYDQAYLFTPAMEILVVYAYKCHIGS